MSEGDAPHDLGTVILIPFRGKGVVYQVDRLMQVCKGELLQSLLPLERTIVPLVCNFPSAAPPRCLAGVVLTRRR